MIATIIRKIYAWFHVDVSRTDHDMLMKKVKNSVYKFLEEFSIFLTFINNFPKSQSFLHAKPWHKKVQHNLAFICMHCFNCSVPPKRIIIRQGHFAENFYFIVSGQGKTSIMTHISSNSGENCSHFILKQKWKIVFSSESLCEVMTSKLLLPANTSLSQFTQRFLIKSEIKGVNRYASILIKHHYSNTTIKGNSENIQFVANLTRLQ